MKRITGSNCCYGFFLNDTTGKCEACSSGYHGKDCAIQCQYPTYGEGCQSECKCLRNECHYSRGCILHTTIDTEYETKSLRTTTSTSLFSNFTVSNRLVTQSISTEITNLRDATLITIVKEDLFFKNNLVISLLGIFVLFFCIFVLTYVFFKCCRKRSIDNKMTMSEWKAQYQSLSPGIMKQENTVQPAHYRESDSAYLSPAYLNPVSNRYENTETISLHASDVSNSVVEVMTSGQIRATDQMYTINGPNMSLEDQSENVYNEILTI